MNYDEIIKFAEAFQALEYAAGCTFEEFENLFKCFNDKTFKIPPNKKICNLKQKKIEKLTITEIYFPILPYGYISGIPPPRQESQYIFTDFREFITNINR